jgi:hypothetical protein
MKLCFELRTDIQVTSLLVAAPRPFPHSTCLHNRMVRWKWPTLQHKLAP